MSFSSRREKAVFAARAMLLFSLPLPPPNDGEVWLATSGVNGIARVEIKGE